MASRPLRVACFASRRSSHAPEKALATVGAAESAHHPSLVRLDRPPPPQRRHPSTTAARGSWAVPVSRPRGRPARTLLLAARSHREDRAVLRSPYALGRAHQAVRTGSDRLSPVAHSANRTVVTRSSPSSFPENGLRRSCSKPWHKSYNTWSPLPPDIETLPSDAGCHVRPHRVCFAAKNVTRIVIIVSPECQE